jgi:hypothetical protein
MRLLCVGLALFENGSLMSRMPSVLFDLNLPEARMDCLSRHDFLASTSSLLSVAVILPTTAAPTRSVDVGGGFDLLAENKLSVEDVPFPSSMKGLWTCERQVVAVDGDKYAAETVWRELGGGMKRGFPNDQERFLTRFVTSSHVSDSYVVLDRGYELASRVAGGGVAWTVDQPDQLTYGTIELKTLGRTVEVPNDQGFGCQEMIRIKDGPFVRAALVKRRFRRDFDDGGNRIVEGLEIVKTFRVLDGIAGTEFPTSSTKSLLRMMRPIEIPTL